MEKVSELNIYFKYLPIIILSLFVFLLRINELIGAMCGFLICVSAIFLMLIFRRKVDLIALFFLSMLVFIIGSIGVDESFSVMWGQFYDLNYYDYTDKVLDFWSVTIVTLFISLSFFSAELSVFTSRSRKVYNES